MLGKHWRPHEISLSEKMIYKLVNLQNLELISRFTNATYSTVWKMAALYRIQSYKLKGVFRIIPTIIVKREFPDHHCDLFQLNNVFEIDLASWSCLYKSCIGHEKEHEEVFIAHMEELALFEVYHNSLKIFNTVMPS